MLSKTLHKSHIHLPSHHNNLFKQSAILPYLSLRNIKDPSFQPSNQILMGWSTDPRRTSIQSISSFVYIHIWLFHVAVMSLTRCSHLVIECCDTEQNRPPEEPVTRAREEICQTGTSPEDLMPYAPWWFSTRPVLGWSPLAQWGTRFQGNLAAENAWLFMDQYARILLQNTTTKM